jgi:ribonuclease HI
MCMKKVTIFTDGSCDNRIADCGGAASVIRCGSHYKEVVSGSWSSTTNNRMELMGIIIGLEAVKSGFEINLTSDSQYCLDICDTIINENPDENIISMYRNGDLISRLSKAINKHRGNIKFDWVRGHTGVVDNERCDELAGEVALRDNPTRDIGSGIGECPKLAWYAHHESGVFLLDEMDLSDDSETRIWCDFIAPARKMSKKEIIYILKGQGWTNKQLKDYEIDTSYYKKPV